MDSLRQFKCCDTSPTLDVFRCLLVTYQVDWFLPSLSGSHAEQAYSNYGLNCILIGISFMQVKLLFPTAVYVKLWTTNDRTQ
jgi:hypothetical protein